MTMSAKGQFLNDLASDSVIPPETLAYLNARACSRFYDFVVRKFKHAAETRGLTQAQLARRIGKKPDVINRWLSTPGNWGLETVSSLLAGICAEEIEPASRPFSGRTQRNYRRPEWLTTNINPQTMTNGASARVELAIHASV